MGGEKEQEKKVRENEEAKNMKLKLDRNHLIFAGVALLILCLWIWQTQPTVQQIFLMESDDEESQQQQSGANGSGQPSGQDGQQPPSQGQDGNGDETPPEQPPEEEPSLILWFEPATGSGVSLLYVDAEEQFRIMCESNKPGELVVVQVRRRGETWTEACRGPTVVPSGVYECYYLIHTPGFYDFKADLYDSDMNLLATAEVSDYECHGFQLVLETPDRMYPYRCSVNEFWYLMVYSHYPSRTVILHFWLDGVKTDGYMSFGTDSNGYHRFEGRWTEAHVYEMQCQLQGTETWSNKVVLTVNP